MLTHNARGRISVAVAALLIGALGGAGTWADNPVDVSHATRIALPAPGADGAATFKTPDGKDGWVRRLSNDAIPTPAFAKGRIFTGAGMSSQIFTAIDALTGQTIWQMHTQDNGPTSPVVSDDSVSYNTESCATETRDIDSGSIVWSEVTGGSLLTQPVVANHLLVIPHPMMERKAQMADNSFRMLVVDLKTGKHRFDADMTADVLGAPVSVGSKVFFTCTDGRLFCLDTNGGAGWHVAASATSAPVVVGDTLAVTTEEKKTLGGATVSIRRYAVEDGTLLDKEPLASTSVGRAVLAKNQRAEWDYQGPKVAAAGKRLFNAPGQTINCVNLETGNVEWRSVIKASGLSNAANTLTPPALGKNNIYLGSSNGHVLGIKQSDGTLAFAYNIAQPLASQPILANGNLYFGTATGLLVCIKLQDADASDWNAWGGNAQHNKVD